jgi:hypothetical protein
MIFFSLNDFYCERTHYRKFVTSHRVGKAALILFPSNTNNEDELAFLPPVTISALGSFNYQSCVIQQFLGGGGNRVSSDTLS